MADYIVDGAVLTDIANAIRSLTGGTELIAPEAMAGEITGSIERETWTITYADGTVEEKEVVIL